MATSRPFTLTHVALATLASTATAQAADDTATSLPTVSISAPRESNRAELTGFGDIPLTRSPLQARVIGEEQLKDTGAQNLRALTSQDASVSDAYNSVGYWDSLTVRGYVLDQRYNYRRDGLPINAETAIALDNKARIELLKGTSGIQAGTSAPGGLANLVVKRPDADVRSATLAWRGANSVLGAVDLATRFGNDRAFGVRVNVAAEHLDPELRAAKGKRHLFALAGDWRPTPDTLIEAEVETSRRSQPSQPAFSLLGDRVPSANRIDPRINLNNQPWSQPVVLEGQTASLRLTQRLNADWSAKAHYGTQRLHTDDRLAFPYGCDAEGNYDRYCSDGSFDLYDFRSENERRVTNALDLSLQGRFATAGLAHQLTAGVLFSRFKARFEQQIYTYAGVGSIDGSAVTPPGPAILSDNTDRTERNTELYLRDVIQLTPALSTWLGLRHTRLHRNAVTTSNTEATGYGQHVTTPWIAFNYEWRPGLMSYVSWGQGIESQVVPNRPLSYSNPGQALPALKSRQLEVGVKGRTDALDWNLTAFDIDRPVYARDDSVVPGPLRSDGSARHRGLEAGIEARTGAWTWVASAMLLHAERTDSADPAVDGQRPPNVPERVFKLQTQYAVAGLAGLSLQGGIVAESDRTLLPDDGATRIPGWARVDLGARYAQKIDTRTLVWRIGVDNVLDRRAWQESPYQFEHAYLYPMAPRTWRVSLSADL
ncbi:TonB-dependent siderophore receptor [Methylibium petroleiphilum]|uniref:TonB-dependent siderophore receptor, putative n=1 Tax=Methylibium petroleiphilum (strain ATCC BAA-1232 / LMG 22953 / PM1) TaxID=420662 RepID=A2SFW8_METPP|nr:TonB-dependent siderophore receptor [Methylibium petroleiphilum]ABM94457.1 TonB-dependent siderophore receptor, putative [Methylibium petroleiphilum PM1]